MKQQEDRVSQGLYHPKKFDGSNINEINEFNTTQIHKFLK